MQMKTWQRKLKFTILMQMHEMKKSIPPVRLLDEWCAEWIKSHWTSLFFPAASQDVVYEQTHLLQSHHSQQVRL